MIDKTLVSDYKVGSSSKVPSEQGNLTRPGRFLDYLLDFFNRGSLAKIFDVFLHDSHVLGIVKVQQLLFILEENYSCTGF